MTELGLWQGPEQRNPPHATKRCEGDFKYQGTDPKTAMSVNYDTYPVFMESWTTTIWASDAQGILQRKLLGVPLGNPQRRTTPFSDPGNLIVENLLPRSVPVRLDRRD